MHRLSLTTLASRYFMIRFTGQAWQDDGFVAEVLLPDTPLPVVGDAAQVQQCLTNLVFNALEAMREGASDFITKPFSMAQLVVRLSNVCSVRILREQNVRLQAQLEQRHSYSNIIGKSKPICRKVTIGYQDR